MRTIVMLLAAAGVVSGCASGPVVPPGDAGPVAYLADLQESSDPHKRRVFYVDEIDGRKVDSKLDVNAKGSAAVTYERPVPARPLRIKLVGTHAGQAPIFDLLGQASGKFVSVDGVITFTPVADVHYRVNGLLRTGCPSVWIEDATTHEKASEVIQPKACP